MLAGRRFAAAALSVFGTPLALALAGAVWFRGNPDFQLAAGLAGLCLGTVLVLAAGRLLNRNREVPQ
jgi:hypothetical protein